jgi:hypothetical protein
MVPGTNRAWSIESVEGGRGRAGAEVNVGVSELATAAPHEGQKRLVSRISARHARHCIGGAIVAQAEPSVGAAGGDLTFVR